MSKGETQRTWGGRFQEETDAAVAAMNASVHFDCVLALEDVAGSIAHARMLRLIKILDAEEHRAIEEGLLAIAAELRDGTFTFSVDHEDVHMNIENSLTERIGEPAGKLHTGRSRNDQVALDLRLWLRRESTALGEALCAVIEAFTDLSEDHADVPMPGYTHLQRAQPVTFGHHMAAYGNMFERDLDRLLDARERASEMPLGSGALASSPLPLSREAVAAELEMPRLSTNSLDAVSDRDGALEVLSVLSIAMVHVSRLAEELVMWSSQEFDFIELSDAFCTGSSLMPQKKNPDIPELLRGKAGRVFGDLQSLLVVMKGLPLAYNKDMQEDKEPLFDAVATVHSCLGILPPLLGAMTLRPEVMERAMRDGFLLATDLADHLVLAGVPFRKAHHVVGRAVALCLDRDVRLEDLSDEDLANLHPALGESRPVLDVHQSLTRRSLPGGPAPEQVRAAAADRRTRLAATRARLAENGPSALELALRTGEALPPPRV